MDYEKILIEVYDPSIDKRTLISPRALKNAQREYNKEVLKNRSKRFFEKTSKSSSDRGFFFKMYENGILEIAKLPRPETMCFAVIQKYLRTNSPYIYMQSETMSVLVNHFFDVEYKSNHCSSYLKRLCEKKLIAKIDKDVYFINPNICYKGDRKLVKKWLEFYNLFDDSNFYQEDESLTCKNLDDFKRLIDYKREVVIDSYKKYLSEKSKLKI